MTFIQAVQNLIEGKQVFSSIVTNGKKEELVLINDTPFIKTPRSAGAKEENYIFSSPNTEEILDTNWEVQ
jgi:hypothetical protein